MPRDFWAFGEDRVSSLLSPDFSSAGSDATAVAEEELRKRLERKRLQEELQQQLAARPSQIITKPGKPGLLSRTFLEPATSVFEPEGKTFSERTERRIKGIPGLNRPSRVLGAPVEALAGVVEVGEGLAGPRRDEIEKLQRMLLREPEPKREPLKLSGAQFAGLAGEALVPSAAEIGAKAGGFLLNPLAMGALSVAGGLKDIGKGALEARRAKKAAETVADVARLEKASIKGEKVMEAAKPFGLEAGTEPRLGTIRVEPGGRAIPLSTRRIPGREMPGGKTEEILGQIEGLSRPVEEVVPGTLARRAAMRKEVEEAPKQIGYRPVGREYIGKGKTGAADALAPVTDRIREMGGMPGAPRGVANGVAAMFDNGTRTMRQYLNETVASGKPILNAINKLTDEQARVFARSADMLQYSGDPAVDAILKTYYARREAQRTTLTKLGVEVPGKTGLPHIDLEGTNIALLANTDEPKARVAILKKWAEHAPDTKLSDADVDQILKVYQSMGTELMPQDKLTKFLPNITEARGLNAPGHLADANSPKFTKGRLVEAIRLYDKQFAFGRADAEQFGANAEKFTAMMDKAPNPVFRDVVGTAREHYVGGAFGKTPGARLARDAMNELRSVRTGALLGQSWIPQMLEWAPRVLPKSMSVIGLTKGAGVMVDAIKEFWSDPRKAAEMAREVGVLSEQYAMEITGARSLFERGAAKTQFIPELVLGKLTPFELLNVHTYALGTIAGKRHLGQLGDAITKNSPLSNRAEEFIREIMPANPDEAQRLINSAKAGRSLLEPSDETVSKARDIYAYNWAMGAAGDAGPNVTPLVASTDLGRLVFHLKNFDYQYTRTILDFVDEAKHGNFAPILTWATVAAPASGYATRIARMAAAGDMEGIQESLEDEGFIEGIILNHSAAGGFGLAGSTLSGIASVASGDAWDMARGVGQLLGPELGLPLEAAVRVKDQGLGTAASRMLVPNPLGARTWAERGVDVLRGGEGEPPMNARDFTPEWLQDQDWYTWQLPELRGRRLPMPQNLPAPGDTSDIWSF